MVFYSEPPAEPIPLPLEIAYFGMAFDLPEDASNIRLPRSFLVMGLLTMSSMLIPRNAIRRLKRALEHDQPRAGFLAKNPAAMSKPEWRVHAHRLGL